MSLNGLDAPKITEAYEAATAEGGNWLLIKYISRDEVDLLDAGSGGLPDARRAIEAYEEKSPLYGLVVQRRKKVLVKYVPEGTSRLLQARVAVHLQSVKERFQHDALLPIASASELQESAVSSVISALKTTSSVKSTDSSKSRRRLTGIQEDADEGPGTGHVTDEEDAKETSSVTTEKPVVREASATATKGVQAQSSVQDKAPTVQKGPSSAAKGTTDAGTKLEAIADSSTSSYLQIRPSLQIEDRTSFDRRPSSQSLRPSISDVQSAYRYKPKIKVGPRPSTEQTPAAASSTGARPISSLPPGIQMLQRQPKPHIERPRTQQTPSKPFFTSSAKPPAVPQAFSSLTPNNADRPPSRASAITVPTYTHYPESLVSEAETISNVTPEKQRLMKALQKRKKARMARAATEEARPAAEAETTTHGESRAVPEAVGPAEEVAVAAGDTTMPREEQKAVLEEDAPTEQETMPAETNQPWKTDDRLEVKGTAEEVAKDAGGTAVPHKDQQAALEEDASTERDTASTRSNQPRENDDSLAVKEAELELPVGQSEIGDETPKAQAQETSEPSPGAESSLDLSDEKEAANADASSRDPKTDAVDHPDEVSTQSSAGVDGSAKGDDEAHAQDKLPNGVADAPQSSDSSPTQASEESVSSQEKEEEVSEAYDALVGASKQPIVASNDLNMSEELPRSEELAEAQALNPEVTDAAQKVQMRRRGMLTPVKTGDLSDATSEDSLLDELQDATVEEAKPMLVSKSPAAQFFPLSPRSVSSRKSSEGKRNGHSPSGAGDESVPPVPSESSSPVFKDNRTGSFGSLSRFMTNRSDSQTAPQGQADIPNGLGGGASSSSLLAKRDSPVDSNAPKKTGVGSLISQRIRAFEKFSTSGPPGNTSAPAISQSMVAQRKTSFNTPPTSAGTDARGSSRPSSPAVFPTPSPSPHGNIVTRRFRPSREPSFDSKQEALSVTATIVRDEHNAVPELPTNAAEPQAMNLHASPLKVQMKTPSLFSKTPKKERPSRSKSKSSSSSSVPSPRESTFTHNKRDSVSSRRSGSSRKDSVETVRPLSVISLERASSPDGERKDGKRRNLLKRMSNTFSRRSIAQTMNPTLNDQPIIEHQEPEALVPASASANWGSTVTIGDVNIQFPDTLLWKRRHMEIDAQGYLVLAPSSLDRSTRIGTKKYHISEFRTPYTPEADREELAHSVILDFLDSSTLQCACETSSDQAHVLQVLQAAHIACLAP